VIDANPEIDVRTTPDVAITRFANLPRCALLVRRQLPGKRRPQYEAERN
jgi:hypothetical protein